MMRKWEFIRSAFRYLSHKDEENAEIIDKIIIHCDCIIEILENLFLDYNTKEWEHAYGKRNFDFYSADEKDQYSILKNIILTKEYCTPCVEANMNCSLCELGDERGCTPKEIYGEDHLRFIIKNLPE